MVPMWMHPIAIATRQHVRAQAERARPVRVATSSPSCTPRPGCPRACSTSCTATRWRSTRSWTIPTSAAVSFVGSTPIAKYVHERATAAGKRVQALGGAKNHAVVLPDADMEFAANHITAAGYGSAGQRCMAISAVVAVGRRGRRAGREAASRRREEIKVGPGRDAAVEMGPVVTPEARDRIVGYVGRGRRRGPRSSSTAAG